MQFEYNPEQLINEVRLRPGIWDMNSTEYRCRITRHNLWQDIVDTLLKAQTDEPVSRSDKRELEIQLQKRWKSLRDCFIKNHSGKSKTKRPYIYMQALSFLANANTRGRKSSNVDNQDVDNSNQDVDNRNQEGSSDSESEKKRKTKVKWRPNKRIKILTRTKREVTSDGEDDDEMDDDNDQDQSYLQPGYTEEQESIDASNSANNEFAFASVDNKNDAIDPDQMFLLSLVPHLKAIPQHLMLDVKLEMIQILKKYKNKS